MIPNRIKEYYNRFNKLTKKQVKKLSIQQIYELGIISKDTKIQVSDKIHISTIGINANIIKKKYSYANPIYWKAKNSKRSAWNIDKELFLANIKGLVLSISRGLLSEFKDLPWINKMIIPPLTKQLKFQIKLRSYQQKAVDKMLETNQGVLCGPTGSGKTIIGIALINHLQLKTLILCHTNYIFNQWIEQFKKNTNIEPGEIRGGKFIIGEITIAMVQSMRNIPKELLSKFGIIILDEAHHCPAKTFRDIVERFPAMYRYGITATPKRIDGLSFLLHGAMGPLLHTIQEEDIAAEGHLILPTIHIIHTGFLLIGKYDYQEMISFMINNEDRNTKIINCIINEADKGHSCLVLSGRIDHAEELYEMFNSCSNIRAICISSKTKKKVREAQIKELENGVVKVLFATQLADEGLDVPILDRLFLTCPTRAYTKIQQQIGRIKRPYKNKIDCIVYDFYDDLCTLAVSQFDKRSKKAYKTYTKKHISL